MYILGYASDYRQNSYIIIEKNILEINEKEFIKKAKEIIKEYHPVKFVFLEHNKDGILVLFRNNKITLNKLWNKEPIK